MTDADTGTCLSAVPVHMAPRIGVDILREAIARNTALALSLPYLGGSLRHFKSRLLAERDGSVIVEAVAAEKAVVAGLIAARQPVGASFKTATEKVIFAAPILRIWPVFRLNERARVEALQLAWPTDVEIVQRRANFRARVTDDVGMSVRVSRLKPEQTVRQAPMPSQDLVARPLDLSAGGMGLMLAPHGEAPLAVAPGDRLRIELRMGEHALLIEASVRHVEPDPRDRAAKVGVQFTTRDTLESRQTMAKVARLTSDLQRAELRRSRRGLVGSA